MSTSCKRDANLVQVASGKQLYVEVSKPSSSEAPAIIFMHGLGSSTTFWEATLADSKLKEQHTLIRYDFDGHGLSSFSGIDKGTSPSLLDLVNDLKDVLDHCGVEKAAGVVGHSMSGLVASHFAAKYPQRLDKLVLLGAMKGLADSTKEIMRKRSEAVLESGMSPLVPQIVASALSTHTKETSPLSAALVRALVLPTNSQAYSAACQALAGAEDPDYSKIQAKTLVVSGAEDYMSPKATTDFFAENIKDVEVVVMKDVGHWHAVEQPIELRKIFEDFFLSA
ncbi:alpha/beta fold hydrolase [Sporobolomyces salmoneus]|uniref:alpha/beta fold hydrolase n=1 Tax=Sporobolomyces salmoneus TaxID=183962 RepID=UPI003171DB21